ncbi:MAG: hypothetical protein M5U34_34610 [Chloroflexi bacterium]|nr:hypothetical protein [Chloroflexota bacterium]
MRLKWGNGRLQRSPKRITADQQQADQSALKLWELRPAVFACGWIPMQNNGSDAIMMLFIE